MGYHGQSPPKEVRYQELKLARRQLTTVDCVKYIMNMKHAICEERVLLDGLGLNQCLLIGKPVLPGWVWGCFTFYELESSRLLSWWSIRSGMWEARKWNCWSKQCCKLSIALPHSFGSLLGRTPPWKRQDSFLECLLRLLSIPGKGPPLLISQTTKEVW